MTPKNWHVVTSDKERRQGEVFLKRGNRFVLKIYKDSVPDPLAFGRYLAHQLTMAEARRAARDQPDLFNRSLSDEDS